MADPAPLASRNCAGCTRQVHATARLAWAQAVTAGTAACASAFALVDRGFAARAVTSLPAALVPLGWCMQSRGLHTAACAAETAEMLHCA